ncbi:MAG: beta strand repeat-containing protein, partial [Candidatus Cryosericum sp.]
INATTVLVRYTNAATSVTADTTLTVGSTSYTFTDAIAANTVEFQIYGFSATVFDFLWIEGDLAFKKSFLDSLTLADGSVIGTAGDGIDDVELMQVGAHIETAFAGINGPFESEEATPSALGFTLSDLDLALTVLSPRAPPAPAATTDLRSWTAVKADVGGASFVGIDGLTLSISSLSVDINKGGGTNNAVANTTAADFSVTPLSVTTGGENTITIDYSDETLQVETNVQLDVFGFVQLDGSLAFKKATGNFVVTDVTDGSNHTSSVLNNVSYLEIGGHVNTAFAGVGSIGFNLTGVDFGMLMVSDKGTLPATTDDVNYMSLKADVATAGLVGIEGLTASVNTLSVIVNKTSSTTAANKVLDFVNSAEGININDTDAASRTITTGPATDPVTLDIDGDEGALLQVTTNIELDVFGFVQLDGSLAFKKVTGSFVVTDGSTHVSTVLNNLSYLEIGAHVDTAFAGFNGGTDSAMGLSLTGVDFGILLINEQGVATPRNWMSLQATVANASIVGIPGLTLSVDTFGLQVNQAAADGSLINFATQNEEISIGPDKSVILDMDSADGELIQASGSIEIELAGFFKVAGDFAFVSSSTTVRLSDGSSVDVDLLTIGANSVDAFAGVNGGTADAIGFDLTDADFALALMTDSQNPARKWMALKSEVGSVAFVGIDGLTVAADTLTIEINRNLGTAGSPIPQDPELTATTLRLETDITTGTLIFELDGETAEVAIDSADTNSMLQSAMISSLEGFTSVGAGNVQVSGTRADGFTITFINELLGQDRSGLLVRAVSPEVATAVIEKVAGASAQDEVELTPVSVNTSLRLDTDIEVGTLTFTLRGETRKLTVSSGTSDATLAGNLTTALAGFISIGAGNVQVSGTRTGGFTIEFINDLAGEDFSDLQLSVQTPGVEASVSTLVEGEEKVTGTTTTGAYVREKQVISFSNGFRSTNTRYELEFNGLKTGLLDFSVNSPTYNRAILQAGLESLTTIKKGNVRVEFDQSSTSAAPRYFVYFIGKLAYQNVPQIVVVSSSNVTVVVGTSVEGQGATTTQTTEAVSAEQQVNVKSELEGSFTLSLLYDGSTYTTSALAFNASASAVQNALNTAISAIGGAGVMVSSTATGVWRVVFGGSLSGKAIEPLAIETTTASVSGSLVVLQRGLTRVDSSTVTTPAVNEVQRVRVEAEIAGSFTLSLTHDATTYTTDTISFIATAAEVQAALASAFAGLADAGFSVTGVGMGIWDIAFSGSLGGEDLQLFEIAAVPEVASASLAIENRGETIARPDIVSDPDPSLVVDFGVQSLDVKTGPDSVMMLTMDGMEGDLIRASGNMTIDLFGFFMIEGGFAFEKSSETVTLADGTEVDTNMLTVGGGGLDAFAGLNGGSENALGLSLEEVDFAIALFTSKADATRKWTALHATANTIELVGIDGLVASSTSLEVNINQAGAGYDVIDFAASSLEVLTGPGTSLTIDIDGSMGTLIEASGEISLDVYGFVLAQGAFKVVKRNVDVDVNGDGYRDPTDLANAGSPDLNDAEMLAFAFTGVDLFVGVGGKFNDAKTEIDTADAIGFSVAGAGLELAIVKPQAAAGVAASPQKYLGLELTIGSAGLLGLEDVLIFEATDILVQVNNGKNAAGLVERLDWTTAL